MLLKYIIIIIISNKKRYEQCCKDVKIGQFSSGKMYCSWMKTYFVYHVIQDANIFDMNPDIPILPSTSWKLTFTEMMVL